jgi:DNA topoisomerase-3
MTKLYLCEKPSQAKDIARVLGANQRNNGYLEGNNTLVSWCFGHLLEMAEPQDYDPDLNKWSLDTLPIIPDQWIWNIRKESKKQYRIIVALFEKANEIVISTDADREGEAIAREVMDKGGWQGEVNRLWLTALDKSSIQHALDNILPGSHTLPLYHACVARSKADWLVGMSYSRLYTLLAQSSGIAGVMSVGRVQTPTLNLVVERDRVIESFKPSPYFNVIAQFSSKDDVNLEGKWRPPKDVCDEQSRCSRQLSAQSVSEQCLNKSAVVTFVETRRVKETPPLPYKLSALQKQASQLFGMGAQEVLDTVQSLYETHKATTYPRTNCAYLPESQLQEAAGIIKSLGLQDDFADLVKNADTGTVAPASFCTQN